MSTNNRDTVFDELSLTIEPSKDGRKIVPDDASLMEFVSQDGRTFWDDTWKVRLFTGTDPLGNPCKMVLISYHGKNAFSGVKCDPRRFGFDTGRISIRLENSVKTGNLKVSEVKYATVLNGAILANEFGIWDGYIYDSPNQEFIQDEDYRIDYRVVSDGTVIYHCDGMVMENPIPEEFETISQASSMWCEVVDASWTVVCKNSPGAKESEINIVVYAQPQRFSELLESLEHFLESSELTRFDDLLLL